MWPARPIRYLWKFQRGGSFGRSVAALVGVHLSDTSDQDVVARALEKVEEIEDCWFVAGDESFLITDLEVALAGREPQHYHLPLAAAWGEDQIGYGAPPVGINLFIASQRFGRPVLSLFRAALPFLVIMLLWLAIVTYVPEASLWWRH